MNQDFEYIVLGTGLKECVLSGLLCSQGKTVLHMDRNSYYGAESASLNLEQIYERFLPDAHVPENLGRSRDYNIDMTPKFIMACGDLVKMLLCTKVTQYLEFKSVGGSFVFKRGKIQKVPATAQEALISEMMSFFEKRRFRSFVQYVNKWDAAKESTWDGVDLEKCTSRQLFQKFLLADETVNFTGHALALYTSDDYLDKPAREMVERVKLYAYSVSRYGNSPYIYPVYGIGGLPEGFSRLSAVHGGVYMLNKVIDRILFDDDGKVIGVESDGEIARCQKLIADPTYLANTNKVVRVRQVAHSVCILSHPIPNMINVESCQIIIPSCEIAERVSDIYVSCVSFHHNVAANGKFLAHVSGNVESTDPHTELIPGLQLLGKIDKEFFWVTDLYVPREDGRADNVFICESLDATSHFETATADIMAVYERVTGNKLDLVVSAEPKDLSSDQ